MANPTTMGGLGSPDWRSDTAIAYAILRLTFGVNLCFRGVVRITVNGLDQFAAGLTAQFEPTWIPAFAVSAFGHVIPIVETVMGLMLIVGLFTRPALIVGGLMMTSLTFGTMFLQNFDLAWLQLTYALAFFILLAARSWNAISLDSLWFPQGSGRDDT
ncbi:MAG: DoxX family membrane protein [Acidobacteria bacterium]|nr:DoxX family membrane protein [Acidobacteriota bacterium]